MTALWRPARSTARWLGVALLGLPLSGCSVGYYGRTVWGGARLLLERRPIASIVADTETPRELRERLETVERIVAFGHQELALRGGRSYRTYVELDRPYAVWNVFAAPELSVEPLTWCFPIAGCVAYRGYFSERGARRFADRLRARGHDVDVGGVAAYSTLGRFADPVLSTFVFWPDGDLAGLLFHELAHAEVYVRDSTAFNESFATAVELAGVERWLLREGDPGAAREVRDRYRRERQVVELLLEYGRRLAEAYAEKRPDDWKRRRKADLLAELAAEYQASRRAGGGTAGYDAWFSKPLDNARLATVGAYHQWVPAFEALLAQLGGDLPAFYREAARLADLPLPEREARLAELAAPPAGASRSGNRKTSRPSAE